MTSPGFWTTKARDRFTLDLPEADAVAACRKAAENTKGWSIEEAEPHRILAKRAPGFLGDHYTHRVEVLFSDAEGGGTTLALTGWHFGKGGGNKLIRRVTGQYRAAIEEQAQAQSS